MPFGQKHNWGRGCQIRYRLQMLCKADCYNPASNNGNLDLQDKHQHIHIHQRPLWLSGRCPHTCPEYHTERHCRQHHHWHKSHSHPQPDYHRSPTCLESYLNLTAHKCLVWSYKRQTPLSASWVKYLHVRLRYLHSARQPKGVWFKIVASRTPSHCPGTKQPIWGLWAKLPERNPMKIATWVHIMKCLLMKCLKECAQGCHLHDDL